MLNYFENQVPNKNAIHSAYADGHACIWGVWTLAWQSSHGGRQAAGFGSGCLALLFTG